MEDKDRLRIPNDAWGSPNDLSGTPDDPSLKIRRNIMNLLVFVAFETDLERSNTSRAHLNGGPGSLPCFAGIGSRLLNRFIELFEKEKFTRNQIVYSQGEMSTKAYIVYSGDFEIVRKKRNKLTKKEEAHK